MLTQLPPRTDSTVFVELADEQRGPYEEQRATLARLLQKNYLTDLDRKRDPGVGREHADDLRQPVPVRPADARVAEAGRVRGTDPGSWWAMHHKAVVFSQWETMILEAAKVLDRLGVGYAVLHGGLPGKDARRHWSGSRPIPTCRVFLSTDAGGTGLNLQVADTVVNLELPWNPAVLEQRIARVHRMGQSRPVRVVNFVTRGTIEEKVLRTLEAKQGLFIGIFEGDADEIPFEAIKTSGFMDSMRKLVGEAGGRRLEAGGETLPVASIPSASSLQSPASTTMWHGVAQLLEAVCATMADPAALGQLHRN